MTQITVRHLQSLDSGVHMDLRSVWGPSLSALLIYSRPPVFPHLLQPRPLELLSLTHRGGPRLQVKVPLCLSWEQTEVFQTPAQSSHSESVPVTNHSFYDGTSLVIYLPSPRLQRLSKSCPGQFGTAVRVSARRPESPRFSSRVLR
uniref:Uncharacterized protein n=1 Tax=Molossus molossus TaxID=27622 RepID=A0A7J8IZ26_MOLMO|nr:hypothetical protein HJG59_010285 [Molossus molossus]